MKRHGASGTPAMRWEYGISSLSEQPFETSIKTTKGEDDFSRKMWGQVGGYVVGYKGLELTTVRGAGHEVPSHQSGHWP